jgi:hypothetical protein
MTVAANRSITARTSGNGVNRAWAYTWRADVATDLEVVVYDSVTKVTTAYDSTNFTVAGLGTDNGGTVTFPISPIAPLPATQSIVIRRRSTFLQGRRIGDQGAFFPQIHEDALDGLTMMVQQLHDQGTRFSIRAAFGDAANTDLTLAPASERAGKVLEFDGAGKPMSTRAIGDFLAAVAAASDAAAAAATSASDAAGFRNSASGYAATALGYRDATAALLDQFDDIYLGAKAADPTTDNDGNALAIGALYWNVGSKSMRAYDGAIWATTYAPVIGYVLASNNGSDFTNKPTLLANIGALPTAGGALTGALTLAADPAVPLGAATKQYVDNIAAGLDVKGSCRVATTANIALTGTQTIDGVAVIAGDRVLAKNQTTPAQNGIYVVAAGAWARATDMDIWAEVPGATAWVEEGTVNADAAWVCTSNAGGTIGTTAINWTQFGGTGAFQAANANLTAEAGLTGAADFVSYYTGVGAKALAAFTAFGRSIAGAANAAAARVLLVAEQLGVMAGINTLTASGTAVLADAGKTVEMNVAGANTYTIPPNSVVAFPIGTYINVVQVGAGITTITPGAAVTLQNRNGLRTGGQWAMTTLYKRATDEWVVGGDVQV